MGIFDRFRRNNQPQGGGEGGPEGEPGGSSTQTGNAPWLEGANKQNTVGLTGKDFKNQQPLVQPKLQTDEYAELEKNGASMGETGHYENPMPGQNPSSEEPAA